MKRNFLCFSRPSCPWRNSRRSTNNVPSSVCWIWCPQNWGMLWSSPESFQGRIISCFFSHWINSVLGRISLLSNTICIRKILDLLAFFLFANSSDSYAEIEQSINLLCSGWWRGLLTLFCHGVYSSWTAVSSQTLFAACVWTREELTFDLRNIWAAQRGVLANTQYVSQRNASVHATETAQCALNHSWALCMH